MKLASKMLGHWAMAKKLEELPIFSKATEFTVAVTAILERPGFRKERKLHEQITEANDSILSNMSEGFEQPTDKALRSSSSTRKDRPPKSSLGSRQRSRRKSSRRTK